MEDLYIIHGEVAITCISIDGEKQWSFSGRDIFVTNDGSVDFYISNGQIITKDWENNQYILDKKGNLLGCN
ncbi:MAG: hypothetical protein FH761_11345 [Firmicutes bacterium]|nr:hypothetical protein [Bacillota bacterium]